jgi:hypothetical protein
MSIILWRDIVDIAQKVCRKYNLKYGQILPCTSKTYRSFGETAPCPRCCNSLVFDGANCKEKIIKIRIHQLNRVNRPLKTSTILNTLAHELAHLKYWDHGREHLNFTKEIVQYIADLGYEVAKS